VRKALYLSLLLVISGCSFFSAHQSKEPFSGYVGNHDKMQNTVYVFIHGIFGDSRDTWKNSDGTYFWELLPKEKGDRYDNANKYVVGYPSSILPKLFESSFDTDDAAEHIKLKLESDNVIEDHERIIFVAHSMGGLAVIKLLTRYHELSEKVPLAFFYATPFEGADIANIAKFVIDNPGLSDMAMLNKGEMNRVLKSLDDDWKAAIEKGYIKTKAYCAYEDIPTAGELIVTRRSATRPCNGVATKIPANHIAIVKPNDKKSTSLDAFRVAVKTLPTTIEKNRKISGAGIDVQVGDVTFLESPSPDKVRVIIPIKTIALEKNNSKGNSIIYGMITLHDVAKLENNSTPNITTKNCKEVSSCIDSHLLDFYDNPPIVRGDTRDTKLTSWTVDIPKKIKAIRVWVQIYQKERDEFFCEKDAEHPVTAGHIPYLKVVDKQGQVAPTQGCYFAKSHEIFRVKL